MHRTTEVHGWIDALLCRGATAGSRAASALSLILAGILLSPAILRGQQAYQVAIESERSVSFTSRTAIDEFEGTTERVDGLVLLDTDELTDLTGGIDTEIYFEVDLSSLETGIGMRDRHMRDNYLEVNQYPYAAFGGTIERVIPLPGMGFQVTTRGVLGIHGVERERTLTCDLVTIDAGYQVSCSFTVRLSDHDIEIPRIMFLKLNNEIRLQLGFILEPTEFGIDQ